MRAQNKIVIEQDAVKILQTLISFESEDSGEHICWTAGTLADMLNITRLRVDIAVRRLKKHGYLTIYQGEYLITNDGREYYLGARRRPLSVTNSAFRDEVLTGLAQVRSRTSPFLITLPTLIDRACLPRATENNNNTTPEKLLIQHQNNLRARQRLAKELGIDIAELEAGIKDGSIRACRGVGQGKHIGIFHRKGRRWQHLCRKCRKAKRK